MQKKCGRVPQVVSHLAVMAALCLIANILPWSGASSQAAPFKATAHPAWIRPLYALASMVGLTATPSHPVQRAEVPAEGGPDPTPQTELIGTPTPEAATPTPGITPTPAVTPTPTPTPRGPTPTPGSPGGPGDPGDPGDPGGPGNPGDPNPPYPPGATPTPGVTPTPGATPTPGVTPTPTATPTPTPTPTPGPSYSMVVRRHDPAKPNAAYNTSATVAAGAVESDEHKADILITVTRQVAGTALAVTGVTVPTPSPVEDPPVSPPGQAGVDESIGRNGGNATIFLDNNGVTDQNGQVTGHFRSSNVLRNSSFNPPNLMLRLRAGTLIAPNTLPPTVATANIVQEWLDMSDANLWTYDNYFEYGQQSTVTVKPRFNDNGTYIPITGHTLKFFLLRADVWEAQPDGTYNLVIYTTDPNLRQSDPSISILTTINLMTDDSAVAVYGTFSPAQVTSSNGQYTSNLTVPWIDANHRVDSVYFDIADLSDWVSP